MEIPLNIAFYIYIKKSVLNNDILCAVQLKIQAMKIKGPVHAE